MARAISGLIAIHNLDCRVIVIIDWGRFHLSVPRFREDESKTLRDFSHSIIGNEFCVGAALCTDRLSVRLTSHCASSKTASIASCRTLTQFITVA